MVLVPPKKQHVWEWPGVVNFLLGGMSAGYYLLSSLVIILEGGTSGLSQPAGFKLLAPALVALGFLSLTIEAGQPLRAYHLFRHLRLSWMSRETLTGFIFVVAAALDRLFPHLALWGLASAAALGLIISHGFIVYRVRPIVAWNAPLVPVFFLTSALSTGSGLMLLTALDQLNLDHGSAVMVVTLICVVLDAVAWMVYLRQSRDPAFCEATKSLRQRDALIIALGVGHLLPMLLLLLLLITPGMGPNFGLGHIAAALAGLAIVAGGASQKAGIILKAGYMTEIALGRPKSNLQGADPGPSFSAPES